MAPDRPLVVTAGEPAGIGPELCLALAATPYASQVIIVGDADLLRERARQTGLDPAVVGRELEVVHTPFPEKVVCGQPTPANAATLLDGLAHAVQGCLDGSYAGLVTAPLAKSVISDAGMAFTGHTEYLAELTNAQLPVMMLVAGELRVALASTHMPLSAVPGYITRERLRNVIEVLDSDLRSKFNIDNPEIVVCGLNPHAGEGGHLGHEERTVIEPVIGELLNKGLHLRGPLPADTAFTPAAGHKDAVLAMYHDQGLPVLKYAGFGHAVNVTLGLPIIRTSVDHGTAFDIAGSGKADAGSLIAAIELAARMADS